MWNSIWRSSIKWPGFVATSFASMWTNPRYAWNGKLFTVLQTFWVGLRHRSLLMKAKVLSSFNFPVAIGATFALFTGISVLSFTKVIYFIVDRLARPLRYSKYWVWYGNIYFFHLDLAYTTNTISIDQTIVCQLLTCDPYKKLKCGLRHSSISSTLHRSQLWMENIDRFHGRDLSNRVDSVPTCTHPGYSLWRPCGSSRCRRQNRRVSPHIHRHKVILIDLPVNRRHMCVWTEVVASK